MSVPAQADNVTGSVNDDDIQSLGGDDIFLASAGSDTLDGGVGSDTVDYSALAGVGSINVTLTGAVPTIAQVAGGTNDSLASIENVIATAGDDTLIGDSENNTFTALAGDDTLDAGFAQA